MTLWCSPNLRFFTKLHARFKQTRVTRVEVATRWKETCSTVLFSAVEKIKTSKRGFKKKKNVADKFCAPVKRKLK